jgi:hypothetical protein
VHRPPQVQVGVTGYGYRGGSGFNDFGDAPQEALVHGHAETLVAPRSLTDNMCGAVWVAQ